MIFWSLYIPFAALTLILYFQFIDVFFRGKKKSFLIEGESPVRPKWSEIRFTLLNLLVFSAFGLLVGFWIDRGTFQVYSEWPTSVLGYIYLLVTFFGALAVHDIYFYWTHRLLHYRPVFKYVHAWHHESHKVNAWSAFSFHPLEGVFQIGVVPLVAWLFPIHEWVLVVFTFFLLFISVYGHCGYELRPNKLNAFRVFNTSLHHFQHHKHVHYNFGIYLNLWDKWFKTDYPKYDEAFDALKQRINARIAKSASNRDE
jgi:Delta7-sterol 5-desaturase